MKISRTLLVLIVIVVVAVGGFVAYIALQGTPPTCTATWKCAAPYPTQVGGNFGVAGEQCGANVTEVYCVGGVDVNGGPRSEVYVGTVSASGNITAWSQSPNSYPQDVSGQSCVASGGYLYCVGGIHDDAQDDIGSSYYAQLEANGGVGTWFSTTSYPIPVDSQSCVTWSSRIYCVAGNNETGGSASNVIPSNSVWYSTLNATGIGEWVKTTPYPSSVLVPTCYESGGFVYCLGGSDVNGNPVGTAYYAPLGASGVGEWIQTTSYPLPSAGQACGISTGYIICVGGETSGGQSATFTNAVYYAPISSGGIGAWKDATDFPRNVGTTCVVTAGNLYCVGGFDESSNMENNIVNYASLSVLLGSQGSA